VRPVMESAHLARGHVEQMAGIAGRVGRAASELDATLDQRDLRPGWTSPQQVKREKRPAKAGADDRNPAITPPD
jgi:hypothetical protein